MWRVESTSGDNDLASRNGLPKRSRLCRIVPRVSRVQTLALEVLHAVCSGFLALILAAFGEQDLRCETVEAQGELVRMGTVAVGCVEGLDNGIASSRALSALVDMKRHTIHGRIVVAICIRPV